MHQLTDKRNRICLYLLLFFVLSTISNKTIQLQKNYPISTNKIDIKGLSDVKILEIKNDLNNIYYKNVFFLKKDELINIFSQYNIIDEYSIKKVYPSKIYVVIKPTELIAQISDNNNLFMGSNGKLISAKISNEKLPYVFGEFTSEKFLNFKNIINESKFNFSDFEKIFFFPSDRVDILNSRGVLIKLPKKNLLKSLNLAYKVLDNNTFKDKKIIDLRVNNHLIVK